MPSAVYLHDGEQQITVTFRTEQDRERFKAHYRALDALAAGCRDALVAERERTRVLTETITAFVQSVHLSGRTIVQHDPAAYERLATAGEEGATT